MKYTLKELACILGAERRECRLSDGRRRPELPLSEWLTDSRRLVDPEKTLFFALKTQINDGHRYIPDLYRRGVRAFVVSDTSYASEAPEADFLVVEDTLRALQSMACDIRRRLHMPLLAIAGSNGKTIVKEWLWQLLRQDRNVSRSPGSYNSQLGVPLSLTLIDPDSQLAILEAGISQPGEMDTLEHMLKPDYGLMTNLGPAHQENFQSLEQKLSEKLSLFRGVKKLVYCADDPRIDQAVRNAFTPERRFAWTMAGQAGAELSFQATYGDESTQIQVLWDGRPESFTLPFTDSASIQNALHCLAFLAMYEQESGRRFEAPWLSARLRQLEPVAMRLEVKQGKNGCVLINDTYNSDLQALELALDFQSRRSVAKSKSLALILSDIYQTGKPRETLYRSVAALLAQRHIDRFVGIGEGLVSCAHLFPESSSFFLTTDDFLASPLADSFHNELVLIKGSRRFGFERITASLSLKSHATVMEVNLDALVHNFKYFRSLLKPATKLVAMVKAEAYGLGALEVGKTLQAHACDALAVAVADEGVALRQGGITIPILIMNPEPSVFPICCEYNLEPEVYSFKLLDAFVRSAETLGVHNVPVHLKLDTGMHRLGFSEDDLPELVSRLNSQKQLTVRSVFSHLAGSDEDCFDDYTLRQWNAFDSMTSYLRARLPYAIDRHILNSAGIERFPQWQCECVRLGIGLYGQSVVHPEALRQVASLKTQILQIHTYKKGETIGYSRTTRLERDSRIAVLPIGYADGFNRHNRDHTVLVNGCRARIMGNICMDVCMIDVTDIPAEEGDSVTIFGEGLTVSEMAGRMGTISYEILTSVSQRVKRIYYHE